MNQKTNVSTRALILCALLFLTKGSSAVYYGNGNATGGGTVANGRLSLTDNGTTVSGTFYRGPASFALNLVISSIRFPAALPIPRNFSTAGTRSGPQSRVIMRGTQRGRWQILHPGLRLIMPLRWASTGQIKETCTTWGQVAMVAWSWSGR